MEKLPEQVVPVRMRLRCEMCGHLHIDKGEFALRPHKRHQCEKCGLIWQPTLIATIGVKFLNEVTSELTAEEALDELRQLLYPKGVSDGNDWDSDTFNAIEGIMYRAGQLTPDGPELAIPVEKGPDFPSGACKLATCGVCHWPIYADSKDPGPYAHKNSADCNGGMKRSSA